MIQQSDSQVTTADQHLKRIENHIRQETSQAAENIKADLKERLDNLESGVLRTIAVLDTAFKQHLEKVEVR